MSLTDCLNNITREQMEQAFEAWEQGYRVDPTKFRAPEECAGLPVSQVSAERTDYFWQLLQIQQAQPQAGDATA